MKDKAVISKLKVVLFTAVMIMALSGLGFAQVVIDVGTGGFSLPALIPGSALTITAPGNTIHTTPVQVGLTTVVVSPPASGAAGVPVLVNWTPGDANAIFVSASPTTADTTTTNTGGVLSTPEGNLTLTRGSTQTSTSTYDVATVITTCQLVAGCICPGPANCGNGGLVPPAGIVPNTEIITTQTAVTGILDPVAGTWTAGPPPPPVPGPTTITPGTGHLFVDGGGAEINAANPATGATAASLIISDTEASLTFNNGTATHGLTVGASSTTLSGGTTSTSMVLSNAGAAFSSNSLGDLTWTDSVFGQTLNFVQWGQLTLGSSTNASGYGEINLTDGLGANLINMNVGNTGQIQAVSFLTTGGALSDANGITMGVNDTLNMNGGSIINANNINANGTVTANTLSVINNATVGGNLGVTGNATVGGNLGVTGATTLTGLLTTNGGITNTGNISTDTFSVNSGLTINSSGIDMNGDTLNMDGGSITNANNITATGLTTTNTLAVVSNATVGGTLGVTGLTTTNGIANVSGNITNTGNLTNNGNATIGGNLAVTGTTTLTGNLTANGNTNNIGTAASTNTITGVTSIVNGTRSVIVNASSASMNAGANNVTVSASGVGMNGNGATASLNGTSAYMSNSSNSYVDLSGSQATLHSSTGANVVLQGSNASLTNNTGHGIAVNSSQTVVSGGTTSTSLTLDDSGATFAGDADVHGNATVTGVANGHYKYDAVNYGQLKKLESKVDTLEDRSFNGLAAVTAMANLPQVDQNKKFSIAAAYGNFRSSSGFAVGGSLRVAKDAIIKGSVAFAGSETVFGIGAGYSW